MLLLRTRRALAPPRTRFVACANRKIVRHRARPLAPGRATRRPPRRSSSRRAITDDGSQTRRDLDDARDVRERRATCCGPPTPRRRRPARRGARACATQRRAAGLHEASARCSPTGRAAPRDVNERRRRALRARQDEAARVRRRQRRAALQQTSYAVPGSPRSCRSMQFVDAARARCVLASRRTPSSAASSTTTSRGGCRRSWTAASPTSRRAATRASSRSTCPPSASPTGSVDRALARCGWAWSATAAPRSSGSEVGAVGGTGVNDAVPFSVTARCSAG